MKKQFSSLINLARQKFIDIMIFIFLCSSLWAIFSIGIDIIPLIPVPLGEDFLNDINLIYLNLSYSYLAGLVIYWFTFVLPKRNRKKVHIPLITNLISNYYSSSLLAFYLFYYNDTSFVDLNNHEIAIRFLKSEFNLDTTRIEQITKSESRELFLKRLGEEFRTFNKSIIPNQEYLTERQLRIINKIRQDQFIRRMDLYMDFLGWKEFDKSFFEEFELYIKLIDDLKNA